MNVAIYSRQSKLTESGESIKNQVDLCKEYALKHFQVDNLYLYEDEGFSGSTINRPKYQEMLIAAQGRKFQILICYRLDRVSRNVLDFSRTLEILTMNNIEFISIRDHFDTSTPMGRAMMYIASVFAQLERETIAERIKDNMYKLAESGQWLGGKTPLGYTSFKFHDKITGKSIAILKNVVEEEKVVHLIYDQYEALESLVKLQRYTINHGIKTRNHCDFSLSSLKNILTNPVYMEADPIAYDYFLKKQANINDELSRADFDGAYGIMAFNKHAVNKHSVRKKDMSQWIIATGLHRPIISSSQWIKVQNLLMTNRYRKPSDTESKIALLTPIITCKNCGLPLKTTGKYKDKQLKYFYYKCRVKESSHSNKCNINNLNGIKADSIILNTIEQYLNIDDLAEIIDDHLMPSNNSNTTDYKRKDIELSIQETHNAIHRLTHILSKNNASASSKYIIQEIEKMDNHLKCLTQELDILTASNAEKEAPHLHSLFTKNALHHLLTLEQKRILIHKIIKRITWDGLNLEIEFTR